ncbi:TlpA disulfide reductase family protein [Carboxylicivirga sp. M1479]|uniref:TlpA family protein disulfide reductase n=1 Tax=Carboxylicivirga sp. M1479 TaxID=2594476 RepID=UPI0011778349|nr:TlpA disulfide reductase family protein [Carboxylicivirga sp. M1479]TRX71252.1 TlpA family protein disulfide reductase [Carboxylicivirga sp. M1479]
MKKVAQLITLAFAFCFQVYAQKHNVVIEGRFVGYDGNGKVGYSLGAVAGAFASNMITPDSLGNFVITANVKKTEFFRILYSDNNRYHLVELIVRPNNRYSFISEGIEIIDGTWWGYPNSPDIYSLQSGQSDGMMFNKLDKGQIYYNLIDNESHGILSYQDEWGLKQPDVLLDSLDEKINRQLIPLNELLASGEIDSEFYEICKLNVQYKYAERLATAIRSAFWHHKFKINDSIISKQLTHIYPKVFEKYPVNAETIGLIDNMIEYTDMYLEFLEDYKDGVYIYKKRKGNKAFKDVYAKSTQLLPGKVNKHFQQYHMVCNAANLGTVTKAHIEKYLADNDDMKDSYANQLIEDILLPRVEEYERLEYMEMPPECLFLDGDSIDSFTQLSQLLKGKPLLIDCWGTWCIPCRAQFNHIDSLKQLIKEKGITMVYIAYEYSDNGQLWESIIKAKGLEGYHFIANDKFKEDLKRISANNLSFPTFIIIDSEGRILENRAALASDGNKLVKQIEQLIQ